MRGKLLKPVERNIKNDADIDHYWKGVNKVRKDYKNMENGFEEWCKDNGYSEYSLQAVQLWELEFGGDDE